MKRKMRRSETQAVLLKIRDAAAMLSVSERSIWQLIRVGELPAIHPPAMRAIRIARHDVENLVERWHNREESVTSAPMSVYKRCSRHRTLDDGSPNPWFCETSPRCEHPWHYYFRVNRRRYRASTEMHDKHQAQDIEARERARILDGRHGIRRQPDITLRFEDTQPVLRCGDPARNHAASHRAIQTRSVERDLACVQAETIGQSRQTRDRESRARHAEIDLLQGRRMEVPRRFASQGSETVQTAEPAHAGPVSGRAAPAARSVREAAKAPGPPEAGADHRARIGELLMLAWEDCQDGYLTFWNTKNGKVRRIPITDAIAALLSSRPRIHPWGCSRTRRRKSLTPRFARCSSGRSSAQRSRPVTSPSTRAPHCAVAHGRARAGRLHGDVDLGSLVDAHARAVHASDARTSHRRAGHLQLVHKMSTKRRTAKRGSRSCLFC
jgi:predicted DNA-binding transcriptional regulator AlpA